MSAYAALSQAGYRAYTRDKAALFFTFLFPLLFLIAFGLLFSGKDVDASGKPYISYIAPGVLSWGLASAAVFSPAFVLMQWRRDDLLRLIRMTPTRLPVVIASRYLLALAVGVVQTVLFVGVALLPAFGLELSGNWPMGLPVLVLGVTAFLTIGVIIGSLASTPEGVAAVANCTTLPMAFLSGSFFPIDAMPEWLQTFSWVLPMRYFNEGFSVAINGSGGTDELLVACGGMLGFTLVLGAVALRTFRWSDRT